ncbi:MAG: hypothetical protein NVS3B26_15520 [Mycobacteriales bacterium]
MRNRHVDAAEGERLPVASRWVPVLFLILGVAMVPWIIWLSLHLPAHQRSAHYRDAWVGYDVAELSALIGMAVTALRNSRLLHEFGLLSGVLLAVDAWFDVMTAPAGFDTHAALLDALLVELPLAALCLWVSRHADSVVRCCQQMVGVNPSAQEWRSAGNESERMR